MLLPLYIFWVPALAIPAAFTNSSTSSVTTSQTMSTTEAPLQPIMPSSEIPHGDPLSKCTVTFAGLGAHIGCDVQNLMAPRPASFPTGNPTSRFCWSEINHRRDCNRTEQPVYTGAYPTINYWQYGPDNHKSDDLVNTGSIARSLLAQCYTSSERAISQFLATATITPGPAVLPATSLLTTHYTWIYQGSWSSQQEWFYATEMSWTPAAPCCLSCTLLGGSVQVFNWPTPAPQPAITTLVNDAGFTFHSPSVYVGFESLRAHDLCGDVGPYYNATTIAFDPDDLSTSTAWHWDTAAYSHQPRIFASPMVFTRASFGTHTTCHDVTSSFWQDVRLESQYQDLAAYSAEFMQSKWLDEEGSTWAGPAPSHYTVSYNPCSPMLSVPTQLYSIHTAWKDCRAGIEAFFDPPSALTPKNQISPVTSAPPSIVDPPQATTTAAAGPTPLPITASSTAPPPLAPTPSTSPAPPISPSSTAIPLPTQDTPPANPPIDPISVSSTSPVSIVPDPVGPDPPTSIRTIANDLPLSTPQSSATSVDAPAISSSMFTPELSVQPPPVSAPQSSIPPLAANPPPTESQYTTIVLQPLPAGQPSPNTIPPQPSFSQINQPIPNANPITVSQQANPSPIVQSSGAPSLDKPPQPEPQEPTTIVIGQNTVTADFSSNFVIDSQTLTPGGQIINSGITYSLASNAATLIIGDTTKQLFPGTSPAPTTNVPSSYVVGTQTLLAGGPAITISGTVVASLLPGGSNVLIGSSTKPLSVLGGLSTTKAPDLGGLIATLGGFAPAPTSTTSYLQVGGGITNGSFVAGVSKGAKSMSFWHMASLIGASTFIIWLI